MSRKLRVLFLVSYFPTPERPNRGFFNRVAAESLSREVDLHVAFLRIWRPWWPPIRTAADTFGDVLTLGLPAIPPRIPPCGRRVFDPVSLWLMRECGWHLLKNEIVNCDIIHSADVYVPGVIAGYWARRAGVKHVAQALGTDLNTLLPKRNSWALIKNWQARLDLMVCNSKALATAASALGVANVSTVYRGVSLQRFNSETEEHVGDQPVRFLFVGGFTDYANTEYRRDLKGGLTLMAAWHELEKSPEASHCQLVIAGRDTDCDPVRNWRERLRHPERVTVEGAIKPEEMPTKYGLCDVVIVPSRQDGMPNVVLEAMAAGRAVIGTRVGGIPEQVVDGETGIMVPSGEPTALAKAIMDMARTPARVSGMRRAARRRVEEFFNAADYPRTMMSLYHQVMDCPSYKSPDLALRL